ncbi:MAG: type III-A CRISPR-associated RAMP protein Csm3 [Chloroflexi bacterium]|nr:type III-A CRISPR-associated RAMP protein Csm3 [Chloroflexota bacterium]
MVDNIKLHGRIFITADIEVVTGLIIGGNDTGLEIGGVDKVVIRNPLNKQPYIPGSSLRGKMRSLLEKKLGREQNHPIGQNVRIHSVHKKGDPYTEICHIFGVAGEFAEHPALLIARDVALDKDSVEALAKIKSNLQFTEIKTEVAIDRVTSQATPRTLERVPAGAVFSPAEWVFSVYDESHFDHLKTVIEGLEMLEDDYLGGGGSRGSGKIKFKNVKVSAKSSSDYGNPQDFDRPIPDVRALSGMSVGLTEWAQGKIEIKAS